MDQVHLDPGAHQGLHPAQQLILVGVGREAVDGVHLGPHRHLLAEYLHLGRAFHQQAAGGVLGLEAHDHHVAVGPPQVVLQVVLDAPGVGHAAARDDDGRAHVPVDVAALLGGGGELQVGEVERRVAVGQDFLGVGVEKLGVIPKDAGGVDGQGRVQKHRHVLGQLAPAVGGGQDVDDLLGALHGKGRDEHLAPVLVGLLDHLQELVHAGGQGFVGAAAVGGFHEQGVHRVHFHRVGHDELVGTAQVAGEAHPVHAVFALQGQVQAGCSQDVPRVDKADPHAGQQLFLAIELHRPEQGDGRLGIGHFVQGIKAGFALAAVLAALPFGLHLLDVGRVQPEYFEQLAGGFGSDILGRNSRPAPGGAPGRSDRCGRG